VHAELAAVKVVARAEAIKIPAMPFRTFIDLFRKRATNRAERRREPQRKRQKFYCLSTKHEQRERR
jgi:hypothetical protein